MCWHGHLSAARCKWFAYGPADATATPSSLASLKSRLVCCFRYQLTQVVLYKRPLNGCLFVCFSWYSYLLGTIHAVYSYRNATVIETSALGEYIAKYAVYMDANAPYLHVTTTSTTIDRIELFAFSHHAKHDAFVVEKRSLQCSSTSADRRCNTRDILVLKCSFTIFFLFSGHAYTSKKTFETGWSFGNIPPFISSNRNTKLWLHVLIVLLTITILYEKFVRTKQKKVNTMHVTAMFKRQWHFRWFYRSSVHFYSLQLFWHCWLGARSASNVLRMSPKITFWGRSSPISTDFRTESRLDKNWVWAFTDIFIFSCW